MAAFVNLVVLAFFGLLILGVANWFMRRFNSIAVSLSRIADRLDAMDDAKRNDAVPR